MHSPARTEPAATPTEPDPALELLARRLAHVVDHADVGHRSDRAVDRGVDQQDRPPLPRADGSGTLRFRGTSYDEAVRAAEDALGTRPHVVAANRIRRGGIGGFFATDLGVEIEVTTRGESIDQAVERLVEAGAADDRAAWIRELARAAGLGTLEVDAHDAAPATTGSVDDAAARSIGTVDTNETDEEYLSDLVFERPVSRLGTPVEPEGDVAPDTPPTPRRPHTPHAPHTPTSIDLAPAEPHRPPPDHVDETSTDLAPTGRGTLPTRRHVDLAVVAASEMIRLTGSQVPGATVSIQITVSTSDGRSVSAEACIETPRTARRASNRTGASS